MSNQRSTLKKKKNRTIQKLSRKQHTNRDDQKDDDQLLSVQFGERDDLVQIDGIAPTTEIALNSIGIRRFSDFENYTPQSLAAALDERTGTSVSAATIEQQNWIEQAKTLAGDKTEPGDVSQKVETTSTPDNSENDNKNSSDSNISDSDGKVAQQDSLAVAVAKSEVKFDIRISHLQFVRTDDLINGDASGQNIIRAVIDCELIGDRASEFAVMQLPLCAQIHSIEIDTHRIDLVVHDTILLQPELLNYNFELDFNIPNLGRYNLQAVVLLLYQESAIDVKQGPLLKVIS